MCLFNWGHVMSERRTPPVDAGDDKWLSLGTTRRMGVPLYALHTAVVLGEIKTRVSPGQYPEYRERDVLSFFASYREAKARSRRRPYALTS